MNIFHRLGCHYNLQKLKEILIQPPAYRSERLLDAWVKRFSMQCSNLLSDKNPD